MVNKKVLYGGPANHITYANKVYKKNEDEMSVTEQFIKHHQKEINGGHRFVDVKDTSKDVVVKDAPAKE